MADIKTGDTVKILRDYPVGAHLITGEIATVVSIKNNRTLLVADAIGHIWVVPTKDVALYSSYPKTIWDD